MRIKCVSLDLQPSFKAIAPHKEYSREEIKHYWYGKKEIQSMIDEAMDPRHENHAASVEAEGTRGLEKYTTVGSTRVELHRVRVVAAVLREQRRQRQARFRNHSKYDDQRLATASSQYSQQCLTLAQKQAYNDEIEVWGGDETAKNDVLDIPKAGFLRGLRQEAQALRDYAFLKEEKQLKEDRLANLRRREQTTRKDDNIVQRFRMKDTRIQPSAS